MRKWGIKTRVMLVALAPALSIALLLGFYVTQVRFADLERSLNEAGLSLARQLAMAAEYGVFSGNREALDTLVTAVSREAGVTAVMIRDREGNTLAHRGRIALNSAHDATERETVYTLEEGNRILVTSAPIFQSQLALEEFFGADTAEDRTEMHVLGRTYVAISRAQAIVQRNRLLWDTLLITLLVLAGGVFLAMRMSREVTRPVTKLTQAVQKLADGDLDARVVPDSGGAIRVLEEGVNVMATALKSAHADLERRIAEATTELASKREEAEHANQAKSRFLAAASHDLRQPMHALGLFIDQLRETTKSPEALRLVAQTQASAQALAGLIDAILDISRLDAGVLEPELGEFPLGPLLERMQSTFAAEAEKKGLRLRIVPTRLAGRSDPVLLERIVLNLVANAVRYTNRGGVVIGCRRRGADVRIEIWDSGIGIPADKRRDIFQEFYQIGNPQRDRDHGLGLGLAIVERLARLLGHPVEVRSQPDKGSMFAIGVPRARVPYPVERRAVPRLSRDEIRGAFVLLIDDDMLARQAMQGLIASWGCHVAAVATGAEATAVLDEQERLPDAILCDYRLPNAENGIEVIRRLRAAAGTAIPAALVSGDTAAELLREAQESGFTILHKPARPAKLRALLNHLLSASESRH
jgi:signal transduction histidine kinase/CheY-like chemotaxis protein